MIHEVVNQTEKEYSKAFRYMALLYKDLGFELSTNFLDSRILMCKMVYLSPIFLLIQSLVLRLVRGFSNVLF